MATDDIETLKGRLNQAIDGVFDQMKVLNTNISKTESYPKQFQEMYRVFSIYLNVRQADVQTLRR